MGEIGKGGMEEAAGSENKREQDAKTGKRGHRSKREGQAESMPPSHRPRPFWERAVTWRGACRAAGVRTRYGGPPGRLTCFAGARVEGVLAGGSRRR